MFSRRIVAARVAARVVALVATVMAACGSGGDKPAAPPASGGGAGAGSAAKNPAAPFTLTPPPRYKATTPSGPVAAAWDGPVYRNGFTPTINVARETRPAGDFAAAHAAWKTHLVESLGKSYREVKVLSERDLAGPPAGKLVIAVGYLPVPGPAGQPPPTPMPLFIYGGLYDGGDALWVVGALAAAELDASSGQISAMNEPAILTAIESFRLEPKPPAP